MVSNSLNLLTGSHPVLPKVSAALKLRKGLNQSFESGGQNRIQTKTVKTPVQFKPLCSLKSHMDVVRGLEFLPGEPSTLVTASEDCTLKMWNLASCTDPGSNNSDLEPYMTLRGHTGPVMSIGAAKGISASDGASELNNLLFSGGVNGAISVWHLPSSQHTNLYAPVMDSQCQVAIWE